MNSLRTGDYHVTFLSRHCDDKHLCTDKARWWPEWHNYYLDDENFPMYGAHMLFSPKGKADQTNYILWTDSVHLTDLSCFLHGPFNFDSHTDIVSAK